MCQSPTCGIRLLGSIEIARGEVLTAVEEKRRFCLELVKVSPDGPSLTLHAGFSTSESSIFAPFGSDRADFPQTQINSLDGQTIWPSLEQMNDTANNKDPVDFLKLWVMHEKILLLTNTNRNRALFLNILGDICLKCYRISGAVDNLNQAVCAYNDAVRDGPAGASYLSDLGISLFYRFEQLGDICDINKSVLVMEDAVRLTPDSHPDKPSRLNYLGGSLFHRFKQLGDVSDINKSVLIEEDAVRLTPDVHPEKPSRLSNLGILLLLHFERLGDLHDINKSVLMREDAFGDPSDIPKSVLMFEDAVRLTPDGHPDKPSRLSNLGASLLNRFQHLGDLCDITKSVLMAENAIQLTPDSHPDKPAMLNRLANSLLGRFERLGDLSDINKSVLMFEDAAQLAPDGHPGKPLFLHNLGNSLFRRFERLENLQDIKKSVLMNEEAVRLTPEGHPDKPLRLNYVGCSLLRRFQRLGDLSDINKALLLFGDAVQLTPDGHPEKPSRLSNLGNSFLRHFERLGGLRNINKSILMFENAVRLTPDGHPDKPSFLHNLGSSLLRRFERLDDLHDINKSILMFKDAALLTPDDHPDKPSRLNNLGSSLLCRFDKLGDFSDITKSVLINEDAVRLTPDGHPDKPSRFNSLGCSLLKLGGLSNISKSILMFENAVRLTPDDHPDKPSRFNNLGSSLLHRFIQLEDPDDINKSIWIHEEALRLTSDYHPDKPFRLDMLGNSLLVRFEKLGDLSDMNKSVLIFEDAAQLTPDGHPDQPSFLNHLGISLFQRFKRLGNHDDLLEGITQLSLAYTTGPVHVRFQASLDWINVAQIYQHSSLLQAYMVVLDLLPQLAWLGLSISDRHHHILKAGKVVRAAAAAAIAAGQYKQAIEWLEQGRSIIWGQLHQLRTPIDTLLLQQDYPDLADCLIFLSTQLEHSTIRENFTEMTGAETQQSLSSIAQQCHEYADERDKLLKKIRGLEGYEGFLLPRNLLQLQHVAQEGPVIVLNICATRCDALILIPGLGENEVMHVPLIAFTMGDAQSFHIILNHLTGPGRNLPFDSNRLDASREGYTPHDEVFTHILSELWLKVVKPVLDALAITTPSTSNLQRVWWCPTGPLAFLPIHAAGLYNENDTFGSKLSDFVISSYTPSLTSLATGLQACPASESNQAFKLLTVAQPFADGQSYLPGAQKEIDQISLHAAKHPILRLEGNLATVDSVQKGMSECNWVHFACHGIQDISNPTESALLLAGSSRLTLSSIIKLSIPHKGLAFLSACQTATGDKELQEESVHLAAGMLSAGYQGIIATMWSITDNDAPKIASDVYEHLFKTSPPDPTLAAEALHLAVRKLREESDSKISFFHWVPYIHIGV